MPDNFRIYPNACIWTKDGVNERLPAVTSGLIAHFPFDGRSGTFDAVGGHQTLNNLDNSLNLADILDWRNPASWGAIDSQANVTDVTWDETLQAMRFTGNIYRTLKVPIVIDPNKVYTVSMEIYQEHAGDTPANQRLYLGGHRESATFLRTTTNYDYSIKSAWNVPVGVWHPVTMTYVTGQVRYPTGWYSQAVTNASGDAYTRYWWFGGLWNYNTTGTPKVLLRNLVITSTTAETGNCTLADEGIYVEEAGSNMTPSPTVNCYPTVGNGWGTYNTNQYNNNTYFSIGTIASVTNNIVTLATVGREIRTYDVLRPQTTGGGVTAGTNYFIKKLSATTFSLHAYDSSQDGSKGYAVHNSILNDVRVPINATSFPTMWHGAPHLPNSGLVKEIIKNGFDKDGRLHDCLRLHTEHRTDGVWDYMAYGVNPTFTANTIYTVSWYHKASREEDIGKVIDFEVWCNGQQYYTSNGLTLGREWQRASHTFTTNATGAGAANFYFNPRVAGVSWDFSEFQCEQKGYATAFTLGTRAKGQLSIPNPFKGTAGSLHVRAKLLNKDAPTVAYKSVYGNVWNTNAFFLFISNDNGSLYGYYPNTAASHTFFGTTYIPTYGEEFTVTTTWSGTSFKYYVNGVYKGAGTDCDSARIANSFTQLYLGSHPSYNCCGMIKSVSAYDRQLTDTEVKHLAAASISLKLNTPTIIRPIVGGNTQFKAYKEKVNVNQVIENTDGWRLVYHGLATNFDNTNSTNEVYYQAWGNDITFTQMKIKCPYLEYEVSGTLSETAKLTNSFRWYVDWLYNEPDANSPQIKFHGLDGVQDVVFTAANTLLFGYGNSWRRITPWHYISGGSSYLGATRSAGIVNTASWGAAYASDYPSYTQMMDNTIRETGRYRLTPKEYSTIQVWVK